MYSLYLGVWLVEEAEENPLRDDLGLVLKVCMPSETHVISSMSSDTEHLCCKTN